MPFYMDIHLGNEVVDPDVIRKAHLMDKAIEHKYGVKHIHYYVNTKEGMGFCLMSAPDKESCARVHRESHGDVASNIIEVEKSTYEVMMGSSKVDHSDMVQTINGSPDNGYRYLLYAQLVGLGDPNNQLLNISSSNIVANGGRIVRSTEDSIIASFSNCNNACYSASEINKVGHENKAKGPKIKVGLATGTPVTKSGDQLFEAAIKLAARLARAAPFR